jgi:hypothetical protein
MAKGAAIETVILLQQCLPSVAGNYPVAAHDINAVLLEKQQKLLARAEESPLQQPPPPHQPNARELPTSWKRKMTGFEAATQEERDAVIRHRRKAIKAQEDNGYRRCYLEEAVASNAKRHSQRDKPLLATNHSPHLNLPLSMYLLRPIYPLLLRLPPPPPLPN